jgi:hypothetical protein
LENEPRKKRGDARKTVKYSKVEELKADIITGKLEQHEVEDRETEDINATILVELGTGFCGVPPLELNTSTLQDSSNDPQTSLFFWALVGIYFVLLMLC